ncbi:hypothetical protein CapIbe_004208 [Capra ibex]
MLPPRKITIQPTAFLEGPSDIHGGSAPACSRRLGGQAGRREAPLTSGVHLRSDCLPSVHPVSAGVSGSLPVADAGLSPCHQPRC